MATYLSREIFEFPINWESNLNQSVSYDLRETDIGFSSPRFERTNAYEVQGFRFSCMAETDALIQSFDAFFDTLGGPRTGFWLPAPWDAAEIVSGVGAKTFDIKNINLQDSWSDQADIYLWFTKDGQTSQAAKITNVAPSSTFERVHVDANVFADETWDVNRLHFVRMAGEDESWTFDSENFQTRSINLIELPTEYASSTAGTIKAYLYLFEQDLGNGTTNTWRYTSFEMDLSDGSNTWTSSAIDHGKIARGVKAHNATVDVTAWRTTGHPLSQFIPWAANAPITCKIYEGAFSAPTSVGSASLLFSGRVMRVTPRGRTYKAQIKPLGSIMDQRAPRFKMGPMCNHSLYSTGCGLLKASFAETGTLAFLSAPNQITITDASLAALPVNYFAGGFLEVGSTANFEVRFIRSSSSPSTNTITLTLNWPLEKASAGATVTAYPGCDYTAPTCETKFSNLVNFGGHPNIPATNLTLEAVKSQNPKGNKK